MFYNKEKPAPCAIRTVATNIMYGLNLRMSGPLVIWLLAQLPRTRHQAV